MDEATERYNPKACRELFVFILKECSPAEPRKLYDTYFDHLKSDFEWKRFKTDNYTKKEADLYSTNDLLCFIQERLDEIGKMNSDFSLPKANISLQQELDLNTDERDPNAEPYYNNHIDTLNDEQKNVFETIKSSIDANQGGFFFIDAPGGTGKTYLLNLLLSYVRKDNNIAIATASSGIASTLLKNGTTSHNRFKFPIPIFLILFATFHIKATELKLSNNHQS